MAQIVTDVIILKLRQKLLSKEHKSYFQPEKQFIHCKINYIRRGKCQKMFIQNVTYNG